MSGEDDHPSMEEIRATLGSRFVNTALVFPDEDLGSDARRRGPHTTIATNDSIGAAPFTDRTNTLTGGTLASVTTHHDIQNPGQDSGRGSESGDDSDLPAPPALARVDVDDFSSGTSDEGVDKTQSQGLEKTSITEIYVGGASTGHTSKESGVVDVDNEPKQTDIAMAASELLMNLDRTGSPSSSPGTKRRVSLGPQATHRDTTSGFDVNVARALNKHVSDPIGHGVLDLSKVVAPSISTSDGSDARSAAANTNRSQDEQLARVAANIMLGPRRDPAEGYEISVDPGKPYKQRLSPAMALAMRNISLALLLGLVLVALCLPLPFLPYYSPYLNTQRVSSSDIRFQWPSPIIPTLALTLVLYLTLYTHFALICRAKVWMSLVKWSWFPWNRKRGAAPAPTSSAPNISVNPTASRNADTVTGNQSNTSRDKGPGTTQDLSIPLVYGPDDGSEKQAHAITKLRILTITCCALDICGRLVFHWPLRSLGYLGWAQAIIYPLLLSYLAIAVYIVRDWLHSTIARVTSFLIWGVVLIVFFALDHFVPIYNTSLRDYPWIQVGVRVIVFPLLIDGLLTLIFSTYFRWLAIARVGRPQLFIAMLHTLNLATTMFGRLLIVSVNDTSLVLLTSVMSSIGESLWRYVHMRRVKWLSKQRLERSAPVWIDRQHRRLTVQFLQVSILAEYQAIIYTTVMLIAMYPQRYMFDLNYGSPNILNMDFYNDYIPLLLGTLVIQLVAEIVVDTFIIALMSRYIRIFDDGIHIARTWPMLVLSTLFATLLTLVLFHTYPTASSCLEDRYASCCFPLSDRARTGLYQSMARPC